MKKFTAISFLLGLLLLQWAVLLQAQDERFSKVFYNSASGMHVLASAEAGQDSLMMISRQEWDNSGGVHLMDAAGVMHWSKSLVREGSWVMPIDIVHTPEQDFLICASETMDDTYKKSILLIKLNVAGEILWVKKFEHDIDVVPSGITLSAGGDILVTGNSDPPGGFTTQLLLLRFTADGALLWTKSYESALLYDGGLAVAELSNENLMVGGYTKGTEPYSAEMSLTQTDASGDVLWAKRKVTPGAYPPLSQIGDLIAAPSGFYLRGYAYDAEGMIMAMDADGGTIWSKSLNIYAGSWYESAYRGRINTTANGDLLMAFGSNEIDGVICQLTSDGNASWSQTVFMQPIEAKTISDGGYLFLGLGPLMGVKEDPSQPQTGIVRTDASGEGVSCTDGYTANLEAYVPVFENLTYTAVTEVGSAADYSLQWEEFPLDSFGGCVTFIGAVEEIPDAATALKVYPNPGNEPFRLLIEDMQPESLVQLTVFNSKGQRIFSREGAWSRVQLIDRKLPAGVYLIRLKTKNSVFTSRLIVSR